MATKPNREPRMSPAAQERRAETSRLRIKTDALVDKLQGHALGKTRLTPTQLAAVQTLLKKTLPDQVLAKYETGGTPIIFNISTKPAKA